mmetsp:Transcript_16128/g.32306  ORF Transcript_16128/g.32306 Transcript_16128/m.32306 type:complete len:210 (-) Transcript_16128:1231-1860(-)
MCTQRHHHLPAASHLDAGDGLALEQGVVEDERARVSRVDGDDDDGVGARFLEERVPIVGVFRGVPGAREKVAAVRRKGHAAEAGEEVVGAGDGRVDEGADRAANVVGVAARERGDGEIENAEAARADVLGDDGACAVGGCCYGVGPAEGGLLPGAVPSVRRATRMLRHAARELREALVLAGDELAHAVGVAVDDDEELPARPRKRDVCA